jgi:hypothetical protein
MNMLLGEGGNSFTPTSNTYDGPVSGVTETVPAGASFLQIEVWGPGGGGCQGISNLGNVSTPSGGRGGGYAQSIGIAVSGGQTLTYTLNAGGAGGVQGAVAGGQSSGSSTIVFGNGALSAVTLSAGSSQGGSSSAGSGGTASGGNTTNTTGGSGSTTNGGNAAGSGGTGGASSGAAGNAPGGGGAPRTTATAGNGGAGAAARAKFSYT